MIPVVILPQPHVGQIGKAAIFRYLPGIKVAVVVKYRFPCGGLVVKPLRRFG
jgi:hypothetical protein